jgi:hypothetical protein
MTATPATNPECFGPEETALFDAGKCSRQVAYGTPHSEYCGQTSQPGADFGDCPEHAAAR